MYSISFTHTQSRALRRSSSEEEEEEEEENHTQLQENRILREQKERIERLDHIHALSLAQQVERKHTNHTPRRNVGDSLRFRIRREVLV
jgi:hypothetical protein